MHAEQRILRVITKLLLPLILLFALYVQFHGDFGPGGGFQAGVIFASGIILYALVFGLDAARRVLSPAAVRRGMALVNVTTALCAESSSSYHSSISLFAAS